MERIRTILMEGDIYKMIKCSKEAITNQEHFEDCLKQLVNDYTCILSESEVREFIENVLKSIEWRTDFEDH